MAMLGKSDCQQRALLARYLRRRLLALRVPFLEAAFAQAGGLADALPQVVELGPAHAAGALDLDLGDLRRVQGKDALDPLALHDAANGEGFTQTRAAAGDHGAAEDLDALFLAFQNALVHVHLVADAKLRHVLLGAGFLD